MSVGTQRDSKRIWEVGETLSTWRPKIEIGIMYINIFISLSIYIDLYMRNTNTSYIWNIYNIYISGWLNSKFKDVNNQYVCHMPGRYSTSTRQ